MAPISEGQFKELLQLRLGDFWKRALTLFNGCGPRLAWDITNVLLLAVDQDKVAAVLEQLEAHYEAHLQYQHPDIRGMIADEFGVNPTEVLFRRICIDTLKLPAPA